jgi:hypothetical protein
MSEHNLGSSISDDTSSFRPVTENLIIVTSICPSSGIPSGQAGGASLKRFQDSVPIPAATHPHPRVYGVAATLL